MSSLQRVTPNSPHFLPEGDLSGGREPLIPARPTFHATFVGTCSACLTRAGQRLLPSLSVGAKCSVLRDSQTRVRLLCAAWVHPCNPVLISNTNHGRETRPPFTGDRAGAQRRRVVCGREQERVSSEWEATGHPLSTAGLTLTLIGVRLLQFPPPQGPCSMLAADDAGDPGPELPSLCPTPASLWPGVPSITGGPAGGPWAPSDFWLLALPQTGAGAAFWDSNLSQACPPRTFPSPACADLTCLLLVESGTLRGDVQALGLSEPGCPAGMGEEATPSKRPLLRGLWNLGEVPWGGVQSRGPRKNS